MTTTDQQLVDRARNDIRYDSAGTWYVRAQMKPDSEVYWDKCPLRFALAVARANFQLSEKRAALLLDAICRNPDDPKLFKPDFRESRLFTYSE